MLEREFQVILARLREIILHMLLMLVLYVTRGGYPKGMVVLKWSSVITGRFSRKKRVHA